MDLRSFPGGIDDLAGQPGRREAFAQGWDAIVSAWFDAYAGIEGGGFYDPRADTTPGDPDMHSVAWDAFPRAIDRWFEEADEPDLERWRAAETLRPSLFGGRPLRRVTAGSLAEPVRVLHRQQDEYCEWFARRDQDGHITQVDFTCEGPEYWRFLATGTQTFFAPDDERAGIVDGDIDLVADLYRTHIDPSVKAEDLLWPYDVAAFDPESERWYYYGRAGTYNPFNRWNTSDGAMHLTHPSNILQGVFTVVGRAAVLRADGSGRPVDDGEALVCCAGFGEPNRASDPAVGAAINALVAGGLSVSVADPVGPYLAGINVGAFTGPDGEALDDVWRVVRGDASQQQILRATFGPSPGGGLTVEDVLVAGTPIAYGGQIADEVQMVAVAVAKQLEATPTAPQRCVTKCCEHPFRPGVLTVIPLGADCDGVDWDLIAPVTHAGQEDHAPPTMALTEPVEIVDPPPVNATPRSR